jgi:hypothetical protein
MILKTDTLNGKTIGYSDQTEFLVQVGKGPKGSYKTRYRIVGDLKQAVMYFQCINVGNGYKKRLLMPSAKKPVLHQTSFAFMGKAKEKKVKPPSPVLAKQYS